MNLILPFKTIVFIVFLTIFSFTLFAQPVRYVKPVATGFADGSSWANASADLQAMINISPAGGEVWVAAGTYKPTYHPVTGAINPIDRNNTFVLLPNVNVYGGFAGTETLLSQRNYAANATILSADIGTVGLTTDNCYHILLSLPGMQPRLLDGFYIQEAFSNGPDINLAGSLISGGNGAGAYFANTQLTLANCVFRGNRSFVNGGAICSHSSNISLFNCVLSGNRTAYAGSAIHLSNGEADIINCTIAGNLNDNADFAAITASGAAPSNFRLVNSIVYHNKPNFQALGVEGKNSILEILTGITGSNLISSNPAFINPVIPAAINSPNLLGDYRLSNCSPAFNFGDQLEIPAGFTKDLDYNNRVMYGGVDAGAYEIQVAPYNSSIVPGAGGIVYVNKATAISGNGSNWASAVKELADALVAAKYNTAISQIWVAAGTYMPLYSKANINCINNTDRENTFELVNNVKIYGGFAGTETLLNQRNITANPTILSGDIGDAGNNTDNCFHVVVGAGNVGLAELNGFTITKGNAVPFSPQFINGFAIKAEEGGAIHLNTASPAIVNCIIRDNYAIFGSGIHTYNLAATLNIDSCTFLNNKSQNLGAALKFEKGSGTGNVEVKNCNFKANISNGNGGVACIHGVPARFINCLASGNRIGSNNQGIFHVMMNATATFDNCTIAGNAGVSGCSAIYISDGGSFANANNSIIHSNAMQYPVFGPGTFNPQYCFINGNYAGPNVFNMDPSFEAPVFISDTTSAGNYRLSKCSPAINAGSNALVPMGTTTDLDGNNRFLGTVDLGAYEYPTSNTLAIPGAGGIVYVNKNISVPGNGNSWANAVKELADALKAAQTNTAIQQIWVAQSTYYPMYDVTNFNSCLNNNERNNAFVLVNNVKIYGGFTGTETLLNQRNITANTTILSGDIGIAGNNTDNSFHVVISAGPVGTAELNGFTITSGYANSAHPYTVNSITTEANNGGAIYCGSSSPLIKNCTIINNYASNEAGGLFNKSGSNTQVDSCSFIANTVSANGGGAIYNETNTNVVINNSTFMQNSTAAGRYGAAILNSTSSNTTIFKCHFVNNNAGFGGAIHNNSCSPVIDSCSFENNLATINGGAISIYGSTSMPQISGSTFIKNKATGNGGAIYGNASKPQITANNFSGNKAYNGASIFSESSSAAILIKQCNFLSDTATSGGGSLYLNNSNASIVRCRISGSKAIDGGAIYLRSASDIKLINNLLTGNRATGDGGGIYNDASKIVITNSSIAANWANGDGAGMYFINIPIGQQPLLYNCIVYGNRSGTSAATINNLETSAFGINANAYRCFIENTTDFTGSDGTATTNPLFTQPEPAASAPTTNGIYTVQKCSPAINGGNNTYINATGEITDLPGNARIQNLLVDIGAYESDNAVLAAPDISGIVYVDKTKSGNGSSWADAVPELSDALKAAASNNAIQEIWVAKGTYYPLIDAALTCLPANNRDKTFLLRTGVKLFGGFAGNETAISQRDYISNETILSGDIGTAGVTTDNCYHVVVSAGPVGDAEINGFTITGGNANSSANVTINAQTVSRSIGGGLVLQASIPLVSNCKIISNNAGHGGGIYLSTSNNAIIINNRFSGNTVTTSGGGIYLSNSTNVTLNNCLSSGNTSASYGGGFYSNTTGTIIRNSSFSGNRSGNDGGGLFFSMLSPGTIYNSIIYGNRNGVAVDNISTVFLGNGPTVSYSNIEELSATGRYTNGGNNLTGTSGTPLFVNPVAASLAPNAIGNYRLRKCSPAINTGSNAAAPAGNDLDNNSRIAYTTVDRGAYEKILATPSASGIIYVNAANIDNESDGSSWAKAITQLGDAFKIAKFNSNVKEIWVAKGIYKPIWRADFTTNNITDCPTLTDRDNAFVLVNNVKVYGGFFGNETDTSNRDFVTNETILSGDFNNDDVISGTGATLLITNNAENALHVIISAGAVGTAELDGFTVTKGLANTAVTGIIVNTFNIFKNIGGGMHINTSSPIVTNCNFIGNTASQGGGIYNYFSSPVIKKCSFKWIYATEGGGIYNYTSLPLITHCSFTGNLAGFSGGGIRNRSYSSPTINFCNFNANFSLTNGGGLTNDNHSSPLIENCAFVENSSISTGGGMSNFSSSLPTIRNSSFIGNVSNNGGGVYNSLSSSPTITNCSISGNAASALGGGVFNTQSSSPIIINSTIASNKATTNGGGIYNNIGTTPTIKNSIVWGNSTNILPAATAIISNSIVQGGYAGTNVLTIDPLFIAPELEANAPTSLGNYRLQPCSPALNIGNNADIPTGVTNDLDLNPRIFYDDVDLGAYEQQTNIYADGKYTTWKGINTNWHNKINWCGGIVPTSLIDADIPATSNNPVISAAGETKNLVLNNNTAIAITGAGSLNINGTYANSGSAITNDGLWVMEGSEAGQSFPGTNATVAAMNKLEIKNTSGVQLDKSFEITGALIPTAGNINVNNGITITLNSNADSTASVAIIQPTASISYSGTGRFEVERFIKTPRKWQLLSVPTDDNLQTVKAAWAEGQNAGVNTTAGFGTNITGPPGPPNLDFTSPGYSLKYWDASILNWQYVTTKDTVIQNPHGFYLFVRGDRSAIAGGPYGTTTLRSRGKIFVNPTVPLITNDFNSIGNPLASEIDLRQLQLTTSSITTATKFYLWDPTLPGSHNIGAYQTLTFNGNDFEITPGGSGVSIYPAGGSIINEVQSGQAFFIKDTLATAITFPEIAKTYRNGSSPVTPTRISNSNDWQRMRINMFVINNADTLLADGTAADISPDFSSDFDANDADKFLNAGENLYLYRASKKLAVERHAPITVNDTFFLRMEKVLVRNYFFTINFSGFILPNTLQPFIVDNYLQTESALNLQQPSIYNFNVIALAGSYATNRFYIVFKPIGTVPVTFIDVAATRNTDKSIAVKWKVENELNIITYSIERSSNGIHFSVLGATTANGNRYYLYNDLQPLMQINYYRIKASGLNGETIYSNIVKVLPEKIKPGMSVYPNPVTNNKINIRFTNMPLGNYNLQLLQADGKLVQQQIVAILAPVYEYGMMLGKTVAAGYYVLKIISETGEENQIPVTVE
ncbi:MAG TPA: choice-of-anchor Q domain-containing protein [Ferruginibacter sp.]|nr:choice-of-anchor Q domain-containing protein [Ferruginibacter sp.]